MPLLLYRQICIILLLRTRIISAQRADNDLKEVYYDYVKKING